MGAGIPTSFGTRAASAKLSPTSFPILFGQCCLSAILPHSDWASLEQRHISGACRQRTRLPTQLTARETLSRLVVTSYQPLSLHPRFTAAHRPAWPAVYITRSTPSLTSFCFLWLLSIATYRLPKSPCHMRHMEQTRRVAVDNLVLDVSLAANPCSGSACACCRAYSLHAIHSNLLPPVTPTVDSSAIHPLHNQPCSTSSHRRCWPPAGHTAASPPRLPTTLTGAPFRSTTVYMFAFPQSQPSSRFPPHLLSAYHPLHP
jgi:hypothetical protein